MQSEFKLRKRGFLIGVFVIVTIILFSNTLTGFAAETPQKDAITKARNWLEANQNEDGSWGKYDIAFRDTSEIVSIFAKEETPKEYIKNSIQWLENLELKNHDMASRILPVIENRDRQREIVNTILLDQNKDGGWGITEGYESDIFDTILIVHAFAKELKTEKSENIEKTDQIIMSMQKAVSYIISEQNSNGSWSYEENGDSAVSLTAQVLLTLNDFKTKTNLTSVPLQTAMRKGGEYLLSVQNIDQTWGKDEDSIIKTLLSYRAILHTIGIDVVDTVDLSIIEVQNTNGSWYNNPYITALAIKAIEESKDVPDAEINSIRLWKNADGEKTECYLYKAYETMEIEVDSTYCNIEVDFLYYIKKQDGSIISVDSEEKSIWNTKSSLPGDYSVIVQMKDKLSGKIFATAERHFIISPSFKMETVILTTDPKNTRTDYAVEVRTEATIITEANADKELDLKLTISNGSIEVKKEEKRILCKAENSVHSLDLASFTPDVSLIGDYCVQLQVFDGEMLLWEGKTIFEVLPPLPPTRIEATQSIDRSFLYPGDDLVGIQLKLMGEGIPEAPQRMPIDIVLILDSSGSMSGTPWIKTKEAAQLIADMIQPEDRCAVVSFGSSSQVHVALTSNKDFVKQSIANMYFSGGGTAMDAGIQAGFNILSEVGDDRQKVFILLSDGYPNSQSRVYSQISTVIEKQIKLFTLGLGSGVNGAFMKDIAHKTGGTYNFSPTPQELNSMMIEIAGEIFDTAGKQVIVESTIPVSPMTINMDKIQPIPTNRIDHLDGTKTLTWTLDRVVMGQEKVFEIEYYGSNLTPGTEVILTTNTKVSYVDKNNTNVVINLPDLCIPVRKYILDSKVTTDKERYTANEEIRISHIVKNLSNHSSTLVGKIEIVDKDGKVIQPIAKEEHTWSGGQSKEFNYTWNTRNTMVGTYKVRVTWSGEDKTVSLDETTFEIIPDAGISNTVRVHKKQYTANEEVNINQKIKNNSTNYIAKGMTVKTTIRDEENNSIDSFSHVLPEILPNGDATVKSSWNTKQNSPGNYSIITEVYREMDKVTDSHVEFVIVEGTGVKVGITGEIEILKKQIDPMDKIDFKYRMQNRGNVILEDITARVRLIDQATEKVMETWLTPINELDLDEVYEEEKIGMMHQLESGIFMVVFDVVFPDGREIPIDSGYLSVQKETSDESLSYAMFAGDEEDGIKMGTNDTVINGDIHSNAGFNSSWGRLIVNGRASTVGDIEASGAVMIEESRTGVDSVTILDICNDIRNRIAADATYSPDLYQNIQYHQEIDLPRSHISDDAIDIRGNSLTLGGYLYAKEDINLHLNSCKNRNDRGIVLCSEEGDISLQGNEMNLTGVIYAPNGTVYIQTNHFQLKGRIIAKKIIVDRTNYFNITSTDKDLELMEY